MCRSPAGGGAPSRGCSSAVRLQQAWGVASGWLLFCITAGYSMWRSLVGQAQAGAPAVSSTVGSTAVS
jgi:hypothetical protein